MMRALIAVKLALLAAAAPHHHHHHHHHVRPWRQAPASEYGDGQDGQLGNRVACGGQHGIPRTLGFGEVGVAHKTLPCGTRILLRSAGRVFGPVRVIDRGPYARDPSGRMRELDLTSATARALGLRHPWQGMIDWRLAR